MPAGPIPQAAAGSVRLAKCESSSSRLAQKSRMLARERDSHRFVAESRTLNRFSATIGGLRRDDPLTPGTVSSLVILKWREFRAQRPRPGSPTPARITTRCDRHRARCRCAAWDREPGNGRCRNPLSNARGHGAQGGSVPDSGESGRSAGRRRTYRGIQECARTAVDTPPPRSRQPTVLQTAVATDRAALSLQFRDFNAIRYGPDRSLSLMGLEWGVE